MPNIRPLPEAYAKIARSELNETPERIAQGLESLHQWLKRSPHLRVRDDDQSLVGFMRSCKHSIEKVKEKLEMYYTVRNHWFKEMAVRDPLDAKTIDMVRSGVFVPLFLRSHPGDHPAIMLSNVWSYDPQTVSQKDLLDFGINFMEAWLDDDRARVCGIAVIIDFKNPSMAHILHMTPLFISQLVTTFQKSSPNRIKGCHFVNVPPSCMFFCNIVKSLIGEKIKKRTSVSATFEDLHSHISEELLPEELGGSAGTLNELINEFEQQFLDKRELLLKCKNYGVDEHKRRSKSKLLSSKFMGDEVEGNFRKISVD